jgi:hypothetical protein
MPALIHSVASSKIGKSHIQEPYSTALNTRSSRLFETRQNGVQMRQVVCSKVMIIEPVIMYLLALDRAGLELNIRFTKKNKLLGERTVIDIN